MREPYQWYILYVRSNAEKRVVDDFNRFVAAHAFEDEFDPFCPQTEVYFRSKKDKQSGRAYRKRPLFPGYVFVETALNAKEFLNIFGSLIYTSQDIIRLLKSGKDNIALPDEERIRLEFLLKGKRCIDRSVGFIDGDKVVITAGPLIGQEGLITYINRHNRYADIEINMFGGTIKAHVALEIVEKR